MLSHLNMTNEEKTAYTILSLMQTNTAQTPLKIYATISSIVKEIMELSFTVKIAVLYRPVTMP